MRVRWLVAMEVLVLSGTHLAAQTQSDLNARAAKLFAVQWSSMQYDKSVVVENPAISRGRPHSSESLTLSCRVEIHDPNLVLGTSRDGVVTQVIGGDGQQVAVTQPAQQGSQMYEHPRYERRFRQPSTPAVPWWQAAIGWVLRRPAPVPGPPQFVTELRPSEMTLRFDTGLLGQAGGGLKSVKGHFHALIAASIEHIDVPFEPNSTWVRLTPEVEIRVAEAVTTGNSYHFRIEARPQQTHGALSLRIGEPLPARMVIARQFLGDGGAMDPQMGGGMFMGGLVAGQGGGGGHGPIKTIRFIIAVDPAEYQIPFEFQNIKLPNPK
jgi:hypothetical protein